MQQRPVGVTVLAVLQFLGGAFCLLAALAMFLGGGAIAAALASGAREGGAVGGGAVALIMGVGGFLFVFFALVSVVNGYGMWKLKGWGRWMTIIFTGLSALFCLLGLMAALVHFNPFTFVWQIFWLAIYALILWYMFTPDVQRAFQSK